MYTLTCSDKSWLSFNSWQRGGSKKPALYVDVNGDSLVATGSQEAVDQFVSEINTGLGGFYTASRDSESGLITLSATEKEGEMNEEQQAFYDAVNSAASTEVGVVEISISENTPTLFGSFYNSDIDIADVSSMKDSELFSPQAIIAHELTEQVDKQLNGNNDFDSAHSKALAAERKVTGANREVMGFPVDGRNVTYKGGTTFVSSGNAYLRLSAGNRTEMIHNKQESNNVKSVKFAKIGSNR